jgi:anti-anti-sigma factor
MSPFSIELVESEPPVLYVRGELDISTAEQLRAGLEAAVLAEPTLQVDMAGVTFIDAAGLQVLMAAAHSRNGLGPLTLVNAPRVAWLLELLGMRDESSIDLRDGSDSDDR